MSPWGSGAEPPTPEDRAAWARGEGVEPGEFRTLPAPPPVAAREEQGAPNEGDPDECQDCAKALGPCPAHQPEERLKWVREKFVEVARAAYNCGLADAGRSDWHGSTDYAALIDSAVRAIAYRAVAREEQGARVPELAGPAPVQPPFVLAGMNIWLASRGLPPLADPWDNPVLCREMRMIGDAMFATMTNEVSAPPAPSPDVAAVVERLLKARSEASGIASGVKGWRMTIPPRPDDSDMLICGAIDDAIAAFAAQARRTEEAERELRRVVQETGGDPETWMGAADQVRSRMCEYDQMKYEKERAEQRVKDAEKEAEDRWHHLITTAEQRVRDLEWALRDVRHRLMTIPDRPGPNSLDIIDAARRGTGEGNRGS
jgi:hypothetical protein